jgi:hypothetical protein
MLSSLSAGHPGDIWVAESLAAAVFAPHHEEKRQINWDTRLEFFVSLPPVLSGQSKTILHHWARCLYQSAEKGVLSPLSDSERRQRIESAIEKLKAAIALPRRMGRDEHPSHLYNTLGVACSRYAKLLEDSGAAKTDYAAAWANASSAFRESLDLLPGANLEALLAFSRRLLDHAKDHLKPDTTLTVEGLEDVSEALACLDEAEEILQDYSTEEPTPEEDVHDYRTKALEMLRSGAGLAYLRELEKSKNTDLGYYCEARLMLAAQGGAGGTAAALSVLERAEREGVRLEPRSLSLRLTLIQRQPEYRYDFARIRSLYKALEAHREYHERPTDLFRHAVVCYQVGDYQEGAERFRKLRDLLRRTGNSPPRVRDYWRVKETPTIPRQTELKVARIITEWRGEGYVEELSQTVPFRPRHFSPLPRENQVLTCAIRFEPWGPFAIPPRDIARTRTDRS